MTRGAAARSRLLGDRGPLGADRHHDVRRSGRRVARGGLGRARVAGPGAQRAARRSGSRPCLRQRCGLPRVLLDRGEDRAQHRRRLGTFSIGADRGHLGRGVGDPGTAITSAVRRSPRTALVAAVDPCTPATWVNGGSPVTSPAAQIRGFVVRRWSSTLTNPRSLVRTPAAARSRPEVSGRRPTATRIASAGIRPAALQQHLGSLHRSNRLAGEHGGPVRGDRLMHRPRGFGLLVGQQPGRGLDHRHRGAESCEGLAEFAADAAAAQHDKAFGGARRRPTPTRQSYARLRWSTLPRRPIASRRRR